MTTSAADTDTGDAAGHLDGRTGWLVVAAAFTATFMVFGVAYSFGAVFTELRVEFDANKAQVSGFFAITTFLYFVLGALTGRIGDHVGPAPLLRAGAVAMGVGLILTSRVNSIWLGFLTYGFGVGIGVACAYVPTVAAVGGWFERDRAKALGVAVAGIGIGTLVAAPAADALVDSYGWRTTYVVLGVVSTVGLMLASFVAKQPPRALTATPPPLGPMLRSRGFIALYAAMGVMTLVLFVPFIYLNDYLEVNGSTTNGGVFVGIIGLSSVIGRLGLGALAARVHLLWLYRLSFLTLGLTFLIWRFAGISNVALALFSIAFGVAYGGFIALSPAVAAQIFGPESMGGVLGALYTSAGIGALFGSPIAGALIDATSYNAVIIISLVVAVASAAILLAVPDRAAS